MRRVAGGSQHGDTLSVTGWEPARRGPHEEVRMSWIRKACVGLALVGLAVCLPWAAAPAHAAASKYEVINGGECLPFPPFETPNEGGESFQHFLYAFSNGGAFCHLRMTQEWPVSTLLYVLYTGAPSGTFTVRLCVHTGLSTASACGSPSTISPGGVPGTTAVNFAVPPNPLPPDALGAYLEFFFPQKETKTVEGAIFAIIPVWFNPSVTTAVSQNVQPAQPADDQRPSPEQRVALMKAAKSHEAEFVNALAASVQTEQRDYAWSKQTAAGLRGSFASARFAAARLASIDCRASKCAIQLQLQATRSIKVATDRQTAIARWISASAPCDYTVVPGQDPLAPSASVMHIYLICNR
jgi:hypothetical protein